MMNSKANAVQNFTQSGGLVRVSQRGVLALMLGTVALPVSGVWAQTVLSGAQPTTQSPTVATGLPLVVTTTSGFSVNTTGGIGVDLYSKGGISFTDANQSAITGFTAGINAQNIDAAGPGGGGGTDLTITTTGAVTGKDSGGYNPDGDGIFAKNEYGGDLTISVASVTGFEKGIDARGISNTGAMSITATGAVIGNHAGIRAYNQGTDLTIYATTVSGGIEAASKGSGLLSITTTGEVTGNIYAQNQYGTDLTITAATVSGGIVAQNKGSGLLSVATTGEVINQVFAENTGTDLTIDVAKVSGSGGIFAKHYGSGAIDVTASGDVSSDFGDGIVARSYHGTDITISATSVSGDADGIETVNYGSGALSITATGEVSGRVEDGLYAKNTSNATDTTISTTSVSGAYTGINALNEGSGALSITATGAVSGTGIDGINAQSAGTDLTISATSVSGGRTGIEATNTGSGALEITTTGAVTGTSASGIDAVGYGTDMAISATSVSGGQNGITADNYGTGALAITATGAVAGASGAGITAYGYGYGTDMTISATSVSGGQNGITADNYGTGALAITATGAVTGTQNRGIAASGYGTDLTISAASVSGSIMGIAAHNSGSGALSITATGAVTGTQGRGINAVNTGTSLTISAASVSGKDIGIYAKNEGSGPLSITVSGAVSASDVWSYGIKSASSSGDAVTINLLSTASVNAKFAIKDLYGDAEVTISGGAQVTGGIGLDTGNDTLTIGSGTTLSGVTMISGGDGTDTLNISSGWLMGILDDWEVINADTSGGDFTLNGFYLGSRSLSKTGDGTLTLDGALTLDGESTLSMGVPQNAAHPLISATGAVTIAGNLVVTPGQALTFGQDYTLIEASALTGTFDNESISGGYTTTLTYTGTSVLLRFDPDSLLALGGNTLSPNASAVAAAFDAAVDGGFDPQAFANLYTQADTLNAKLRELSGELHSAERRAALADTSVVRDAALDRLGGGFTGGAGGTFWAQGLGSWGTADADGTGAAVTTQQSGVLMGVDFAQGDITYGGMFSYTNTGVDLASLGHSDVASTGSAVYAGYRPDGAGLSFGIGGALASTSAKGERSISITGLEQTLTSTAQGTSYQIFGEVSNDMAKAGNVQIEPFARLAYAKVDSDAFAETGGSAALSGAAQSNDLRTATFGLRGTYTAGTTTLSGSAAWLHSAGDLSAPTTLSMGGVDTPYEVNSAALDQNALELAVQASTQLSSGAMLAGGYSGMIGSANTNHGLRVTLSMAW